MNKTTEIIGTLFNQTQQQNTLALSKGKMWHSQIGGNGLAHHVHISTQWNVNAHAW